MYYRKRRAEVINRELWRLARKQNIKIEDWSYRQGLFYSTEEFDNSDVECTNFNTENDKWIGKDQNGWFSTKITITENFANKPISLIFRTQASGWDANNPQFLAYINGKATCGLDTNHTDIFLTDSAKEGDVYRIDLQAYSGSTHSELCLIANMLEVDPLITKLYYDIRMPLLAIGRMDENDKTRIDIEVALEKTINAIDLREPYSEDFYSSVNKALEIIDKEIYTDLAGYNDVIATCVGHTHIDVAWWWTVAQTRQKVARSFSTVLKYMEEYPNYIFMSSQPQLYKFLKQHHPDLFERVKEHIVTGRWEAEGGMWLEADCNITSGESLVRQFLYGKKFFKEEFNVDNKILWLPDVFGYSAALPQIMKLCGIDYFMTTKISWNQFNRLPVDTFWWRGIDKSEVFVHMITTTGAEDPMKNFFTTYNGNLTPNDLMGAWERYQQKEFNNDILISYGYGDGGGGPTKEMIEIGERMKKGVKGTPMVRFANSRQYFDELHEKVKDNDKLPRWVGELYFEYHRGTYTSMARNKRANRKCEFLLTDLEFLSVLAESLGCAYPKQEIYDFWEKVLLNQFHDILPGTSIKEVYEVTKAEYDEIKEKASDLLKHRFDFVADKMAIDANVVLFNTLSFNRDDIVNIGENLLDLQALTDGENTYIAQSAEDGGIISYIKNIPAKGIKPLYVSKPSEYENPLVINGFDIETPFYNVKFNENGLMSSLIYKKTNREVLKQGGLGNELRVYEDKPMDYDNWDIDIYYTEKSWVVDNIVTMEWIEKGPVRATLLIERNFLQSTIRQKIRFYADVRRIDFDTVVDWKQKQMLLKTNFPIDVNAPEATYDIQFGNVKRPTHKNTSWDVARFETCAHKWADLSEGDFGVSLMNDCKYGHAIHDGNMALTLIKSGTVPNPTTDQETHYFTYSIMPHEGSWCEAKTAQEAYCLNVPTYAVLRDLKPIDSSKDAKNFNFISIDSENVFVEAIKKAENSDSIIVRMYEFENKRTRTTIKLHKKAVEIYETDCLENRLSHISSDADTFEFEIKPYEIKTFELKF